MVLFTGRKVILMTKVGIINGISTMVADYYHQRINELADERINDNEAHFTFVDVDLDRFTPDKLNKYWNSLASWFMAAAIDLRNKSACEYVAVTSNFMHKLDMYGEITLQKELSDKKEKIPCFVDMNDCVAEKLEEVFAKKILMLGPKYIMGDRDIAESYKNTYGIEIMSLANYRDEVAEVDRIINEELAEDIISVESKEFLVNFVNQFPCDDSDERPDAIVLGCYELSLILDADDVYDEIPFIDGAEAHIEKIVSLASS